MKTHATLNVEEIFCKPLNSKYNTYININVKMNKALKRSLSDKKQSKLFV